MCAGEFNFEVMKFLSASRVFKRSLSGWLPGILQSRAYSSSTSSCNFRASGSVLQKTSSCDVEVLAIAPVHLRRTRRWNFSIGLRDELVKHHAGYVLST